MEKGINEVINPTEGFIPNGVTSCKPILDTDFFSDSDVDPSEKGQAIKVGDMWTNIILSETGERVSFEIVKKWSDGSAMDMRQEAQRAKIDGVIYREKAGEYYKLISPSESINIRWFGAKGDGVTDDTKAFEAALKLKLNIFVPAGTYRITARLESENIFLYGTGSESSIIKTDIPIKNTGDTELDEKSNAVFLNPSRGNIRDLKFVAATEDALSLFFRESGAFSCRVHRCYFENYECVFDLRGNANSMYITDNYFYRGRYAVRGNLAHATIIERNIFRQQEVRSLELSRGTGMSIRSNHFSAAKTKPCTIYFFSVKGTFEDNYFEAYTGIEGEPEDCMIEIEYNAEALMPVLRNNLFNGKSLFNYGLRLTGTSKVNKNVLTIHNTSFAGTLHSQVIGNIQNFRKMDIRRSLGVIEQKTPRKFTSVITVNDIKEEVVIPNMLQEGLNDDPHSILQEGNYLKPPIVFENTRYLLKISGYYSSDSSCGFILRQRKKDSSEVMEREISIGKPGQFSIPEFSKIYAPTKLSQYSFSLAPSTGANFPQDITMYVEFEEIM